MWQLFHSDLLLVPMTNLPLSLFFCFFFSLTCRRLTTTTESAVALTGDGARGHAALATQQSGSLPLPPLHPTLFVSELMDTWAGQGVSGSLIMTVSLCARKMEGCLYLAAESSDKGKMRPDSYVNVITVKIYLHRDNWIWIFTVDIWHKIITD